MIGTPLGGRAAQTEGEARNPMAYIVAFGSVKRELFELEGESMVLGRERKARVSISDFQVSRRHAEILADGDGWKIRDLGSRNGFHLNGELVPSGGEAPLVAGDELVFGKTPLRVYESAPADLDGLDEPELPEAVVAAQAALEAAARQKNKAKARARTGDEAGDAGEDPALLETDAASADDEEIESLDDPKVEEIAPEAKSDHDANALTESEIRRFSRGDGDAPDVTPPKPRFTELSEDPEPRTERRRRGSERAEKRDERRESGRPDSERKTGSSARRRRGSSRRQKADSGRRRGDSGRGKKGSGRAREAANAEVHSIKALLDRSERERAFYRNLTLGLVGFLMLLVGVLVLKLMAGGGETPKPEPDKTPKIGVTDPGDSPDRPPVGPAVVSLGDDTNVDEILAQLDSAVFQSEILPWLERSCSACHGQKGGAPLKANFADADDVLRTFARAVVPGQPSASPLLTKPLGVDQGGVVHGGGTLLRTGTPEFAALRDWIQGTTAGPSAPDTGMDEPDLDPVAKIDVATVEVAVGEQVRLDSRGSKSKTNSTLLCQWAIIGMPEGSQAVLDDEGAELAHFVPDLPGSYRIELIVRDGSYTGRTELTLTATGAAMTPGQRPKPGDDPKTPDKPSGPPDAVVAGIFKRAVGRDPKPDEIKELKKSSVAQTVRAVVATPEAKLFWLKSELATFGLTGPNRLPTFYVKQLAKQLSKGDEFTVRDAFVEFAISPKFQILHSDPKDYVEALFTCFLGRKPAGRERFSSLKMYDGKEATLFGKKGRGQAEIAAILARQPEFEEAFLKRAYKLYKGKDPSDRVLETMKKRYSEDPSEFFRFVEIWVKPSS